jgi:hypothetical protein
MSGAGLLILMAIIVITTNLRLIVENILKYGVLTRPQAWVLALLPSSDPLLLLSWPAMALCILVAWGIEHLGAGRLRAERKARRSSDMSAMHLDHEKQRFPHRYWNTPSKHDLSSLQMTARY